MVVVLSGQTYISSIAYGLRKYEAFHIDDINNEGFINYFAKNKVPQSVNKSESDSDNIMYLKAFDFGLHLSQNIFAKQQGKEDLYDLCVDYENFSKISISQFNSHVSDPDRLVKLLAETYGKKVSEYFQTVSSFKNCEFCGQKISVDATECPNCYLPL